MFRVGGIRERENMLTRSQILMWESEGGQHSDVARLSVPDTLGLRPSGLKI
jgi:hypothetical protein